MPLEAGGLRIFGSGEREPDRAPACKQQHEQADDQKRSPDQEG